MKILKYSPQKVELKLHKILCNYIRLSPFLWEETKTGNHDIFEEISVTFARV